ncbi:hypothetical protein G6011_00219 [Alternaria panax]|uniref:Uncharacterized protein n=1 Tax=Alternaria panax TaxID=48097 RepID=A0AAD4NUU8_9PLEO|nr:hypothetical protein G6011_00219 [Alternaria panax]
MSPRRISEGAEEQYPPAPSVEDDVAATGNDNFKGLRQEAVNAYFAYERMAQLHLENDEAYVNNDNHSASQSITEGYEDDKNDESPPLPSARFRSAVVESPQRSPAQLQYCAVPVPPPPTIILRNVPHTAPVVSLPVTEAEAWSQFMGRAPRDFVPHRRRYLQPGHASTNGYFENLIPRGVMPGGCSYSRGVEGVDQFTRPHHTMPTRNRGPIERDSFAMPHAVNRDFALREEPVELFEIWADTFSRSRRIEEDVAILRERFQLLHEFYYRS